MLDDLIGDGRLLDEDDETEEGEGRVRTRHPSSKREPTIGVVGKKMLGVIGCWLPLDVECHWMLDVIACALSMVWVVRRREDGGTHPKPLFKTRIQPQEGSEKRIVLNGSWTVHEESADPPLVGSGVWDEYCEGPLFIAH